MNCEICGSDYPSKYHFDVEWICTSCFENLDAEKKAEITATRSSLREEREEKYEKSQAREPKNVVGCGLVVVAVIFSVAAVSSSLTLQAVFFTMEDYLEEPMWTSHIPAVVGVPSVLVSFVGGLGSGIGPWIAGAFGLFFLVTGMFPRVVPRVAALAVLVPLVALMLHTGLLAVGHILVRGGMPPDSSAPLIEAVVSLAVPGFLAVLLWWKIRTEWPWKNRDG